MADGISSLREELNREIKSLRKEVARIEREAGTRARHAISDAGELLDDGRDHAQKAAHQMRHQARLAAKVARHNPQTATTILAGAGLFGAMLGLVAGVLLANRDH